MMRAKFPRERFLVLPSAKRHRLEAHLPCVLNSEVSQSANAVHGYHVAGTRAGVAQGIEDGHAHAHEWSGFFGR